MSTQKFNGLLKEIATCYPDIDVADHLEFELGIPRFKAEALAKRIEEKCLSHLPEKTVKPAQRLFEPQIEEMQKTVGLCVGCLSDKEFRTFICWLLEGIGYMLHQEKTTSGWGFEALADKDNEKTLIQAIRAPINCAVSEVFIAIAEQSKQKHKCHRTIVIATGKFTQKAVEEAQETDIELWNPETLNQKIEEAKKNCEVQTKSRFPPYQGSLFDSLLKLEEGKEFLIELKAEWRYELLLPGVKYPLLTFQTHNGEVTQCVFRIKYNEPVTETEGEVIIGSDETGNRVGPNEAQAYVKIKQYLEQFLE